MFLYWWEVFICILQSWQAKKCRKPPCQEIPPQDLLLAPWIPRAKECEVESLALAETPSLKACCDQLLVVIFGD